MNRSGLGFKSESETYAKQEAQIGTICEPADWGFLEATALDHNGNLAIASTEVYNGTLDGPLTFGGFHQCANVESNEYSHLSTLQIGDLYGTSGTIENYAGNATGDVYSHVKLNFTTDCDHTGTVVFTLLNPAWSKVDAESNGDTETQAGLKGGALPFNMHIGLYADSPSHFASSFDKFSLVYTAKADSDGYTSHASVKPH